MATVRASLFQSCLVLAMLCSAQSNTGNLRGGVPSSGALPFNVQACTCYHHTGDLDVAKCFTGEFAQCSEIYLPVYNYAKQLCNPDADYWDTIASSKGNKAVFGMVNVPNGVGTTKTDWDKVAQCATSHGLAGFIVDAEKADDAQCQLEPAQVATLSTVHDLRMFVSTTGTCHTQWLKAGVDLALVWMCYDGNEHEPVCQACPNQAQKHYMFGQGSYSATMPSSACQASGSPLEYFFA